MEVLLSSIAARQSRFAITDPSDVSFVRRAVLLLARSLSFGETDKGRLALIVTECATNILKHAGRGELLVSALSARSAKAAQSADLAQPADVAGIEIVALDRGPGIADMAACFADGFTTAGSPGTGLGAIRRQAHELDIWSWPQSGCVLRAVLWAGARAPNDASHGAQFGAVNLPVAGESACGDAWAIALDADGATFLLADGLGHGPLAEAAAVAAVNCLMARPGASPTRLTEDAHAALRPTRGAALGIARLAFVGPGGAAVERRARGRAEDAAPATDASETTGAPSRTPVREAGEVSFVGVGNIAAVVRSESGNRHLVSHNGIVGHTLRKLQQFSVGWPDDALLIMHSDGLGSRWDLAPYPGLPLRHPAVIAAVLYRDFTRGRDDVTVLVARFASAAPRPIASSALSAPSLSR